ncbi:CapA family protein [Eisenibacter elegans]|jgi:hypothetical protein|uniref:CapA family protein n=1 Tax=Eisenibacter elegans TaxID=997 RepID=UPI00040CAF1C|nr:CapA family protein [Eisenibacter elegans]
MKKNLRLVPYLFLLLWGAQACGSATNAQRQQEASDSVPAQSPETTPLFVVTGYGRTVNNYPLDSLKADYCAGRVYVLEAAKPLADVFFGCANAQTVPTLKAFAQLAKEACLVTDLHHLVAQYKALAVDGVSFWEQADKYPLVYLDDERTPFDFQKHITKFMLTGVTAITRNTGFAADAHGTAFLTQNLLPYFKGAEWVHISNEVSFAEGCYYKSYDPNYLFCTKKEHFQTLIDLGTNIVELTGNHNLDYGKEPYRQTFEWYQAQKMQTFGGGLSPEQANTPLVVTLKDGKKLGFIGFNEKCPSGECADVQMGANRYEREKARQGIRKMRQELRVDYIIATCQFGEVDSYQPTPTQARISRDLIDFGADMVYGSQAHQPQEVEFYKGKPIFHGLGNFLFDQVHRLGVRQAFFLQNYFYQGQLIQAVPVFTFMAMNRQPTIANAEEEAGIRKVIFTDKQLYKWE